MQLRKELLLSLKAKLFPADGGTPWKAVFITSAVAFTVSIQLSVFFSSMWPYMQLVDKSSTETFFGYAMASYSLGTMISAPLMGYWSQRLGSVSLPIQTSLAFGFVGNLFYILCPLFSFGPKYAMLISRFLHGVSDSVLSLSHTFIAAATPEKERSRAISALNTGYCVGTTIGPVFQLMFTPLDYPGVQLFANISLNMYSAPAFFSAIICILSVILVYFQFKEEYPKEIDEEISDETKLLDIPPYDKIGVFCCYAARFQQLLVFTNLETLGSPFIMTMFAMSGADAVKYFSIAHSVTGILGLISNAGFTMISVDKWVDMRRVCLLGTVGFLVFHLLTFSYPFVPGHLKTYTQEDYELYVSGNITQEPVGCPRDRFDWCDSTAPVNVWVYFVSFALLVGICYPNVYVSLSTVFSKVLGPRPQNTQQSGFQVNASVARIVGPIAMSYVYAEMGPRIAWIMEMGIVGVTIVLWLIFYRRLAPLTTTPQQSPQMVAVA